MEQEIITPEIECRIRVMMAERHIKTIKELHRRLTQIGVTISSAQLSRVVDGKWQRINSELLAGMAVVMDCEIGDLLRLARTQRI